MALQKPPVTALPKSLSVLQSIQQPISAYLRRAPSITLSDAAQSAREPLTRSLSSSSSSSFLPQSSSASFISSNGTQPPPPEFDASTRSPPPQFATRPTVLTTAAAALFLGLEPAAAQPKRAATDKAFCSYQNGCALWCGLLARKQLAEVRELQRTCDYECLDAEGNTADQSIVEIDYAPLSADLAQNFRVVCEDDQHVVDVLARAKIVRNTLDFPKAVAYTTSKKAFVDARREAAETRQFKAKVHASRVRGRVFDDKEGGIALKEEAASGKKPVVPQRARDFLPSYEGLP